MYDVDPQKFAAPSNNIKFAGPRDNCPPLVQQTRLSRLKSNQ